MNKLQRFDKKLIEAGLTVEQRIAVVEAATEYGDEQLHEYYESVEAAITQQGRKEAV